MGRGTDMPQGDVVRLKLCQNTRIRPGRATAVLVRGNFQGPGLVRGLPMIHTSHSVAVAEGHAVQNRDDVHVLSVSSNLAEGVTLPMGAALAVIAAFEGSILDFGEKEGCALNGAKRLSSLNEADSEKTGLRPAHTHPTEVKQSSIVRNHLHLGSP